MLKKILVSSCLLGENCRWHGKKVYKSGIVKRFEVDHPDYKIISFCPEIAGGLKVPRKPVKRKNGKVFNTCADKENRKNVTGRDVTKYFIKGANEALKLCKKNKIKKAILCKWSPSCDINGITGKLLTKNKIEIYNTF